MGVRETEKKLEEIMSDGYWHICEELKESLSGQPWKCFYHNDIP